MRSVGILSADCGSIKSTIMVTTYTQFDWASDRLARMSWDEDEFVEAIDRRMNKRSKRTSKLNKKNHRNYA